MRKQQEKGKTTREKQQEKERTTRKRKNKKKESNFSFPSALYSTLHVGGSVLYIIIYTLVDTPFTNGSLLCGALK